jgi:hypothetical protein
MNIPEFAAICVGGLWGMLTVVLAYFVMLYRIQKYQFDKREAAYKLALQQAVSEKSLIERQYNACLQNPCQARFDKDQIQQLAHYMCDWMIVPLSEAMNNHKGKN